MDLNFRTPDNSVYYLYQYENFFLFLDSLSPPTCLILEVIGRDEPYPSNCDAAFNITQSLNRSDRFWWNTNDIEPVSFAVFDDETALGGCGSLDEGNLCTITIGGDPEPTATPMPEPTVVFLPRQDEIPIVVTNSGWIPEIYMVDGVEMAVVPKGCFFAGAPEASTEVCIDTAFLLDRYEVSYELYASLIDNFEIPDSVNNLQLPLTNISISDAQTYCELRGGDLPSDMQWEFAARGPDSLIYTWSQNRPIPDNIVYGEAQDAPLAVTEMPDSVSWVGAANLLANVAEWVQVDESEEMAIMMTRGGSWADETFPTTYTVSTYDDLEYLDATIGFRCANDIE